MWLGFIVDLISAPVISGFCSAAALTAIATQMKGLLGLKFQGSSFLTVWRGVFENLSDINFYDAGLGFLTIFMLLIMRVSSLLPFLSRQSMAFTTAHVGWLRIEQQVQWGKTGANIRFVSLFVLCRSWPVWWILKSSRKRLVFKTDGFLGHCGSSHRAVTLLCLYSVVWQRTCWK